MDAEWHSNELTVIPVTVTTSTVFAIQLLLLQKDSDDHSSGS